MFLGASGCRVLTREQLFMYMQESESRNINDKLNHLENYLFYFGPFLNEDTVKK